MLSYRKKGLIVICYRTMHELHAILTTKFSLQKSPSGLFGLYLNPVSPHLLIGTFSLMLLFYFNSKIQPSYKLIRYTFNCLTVCIKWTFNKHKLNMLENTMYVRTLGPIPHLLLFSEIGINRGKLIKLYILNVTCTSNN